MRIFNIKKIVTLIVCTCAFSTYSANTPIEFRVTGSFDEHVPPCILISSPDIHFPLGTIPTFVNVGYETDPQSQNISYRCFNSADLKIYFSNAPHPSVNTVHRTTAEHIGLKVKINGKTINPNEKLELKANAGDYTMPIDVSLIRLAETQGEGGSYAFILHGIIEAKYN